MLDFFKIINLYFYDSDFFNYLPLNVDLIYIQLEFTWRTIYCIFLREFGFLSFLPYPQKFLAFTITLFFIGFYGLIFHRRNFIHLLICFEILSLSIVFNFFYVGLVTQIPSAFTYGLLVIGLAAVESTVGLSIIVAYYRRFGSVNIILKEGVRTSYK